MTQNKKIASLDIGDVWTGIALSDSMHIIASPFQTIQTVELKEFLHQFIEKQQISAIVVGIPITLRGQESEQTKKTKRVFETLKNAFPSITFVPIDERFSSKQATDIQKERKKGTIEKIKAEKLKNHAIAAAFILDSYLQQLQFQRSYTDHNEEQ